MPKAPKLQPKQPQACPAKEPFQCGSRVQMRVSNYVIYPSAMSLVKSYMNKAQEAGLVQSPSDFKVGVRAMIAAGMAKADEHKVKFVTPQHVKLGWSEKLSVGGGNCPPHRCVARSVLNRVEHLRESLPYFKEFLDEI